MMPFQRTVSILLFTLAWHACAQTTGGIAGEIRDSSQATVSGAAVRVRNEQTALEREMTSDAAGRYAFAGLPIGSYNVTAERAGFQTQTQVAATLGVAEWITLNFIMTPGPQNESVKVEARIAPVDVRDTSLGLTVHGRELTDLPINGRDYTRFSLLAPGAVARTNMLADLSFNGLQTVDNQFSIDGVSATRIDNPYIANGAERGARLLTGSLDSIAEFRAQTGNYQTEYGRAAGAYVNIATKAGTNQRHGALFEYFRNNALDARNFFNAKPAAQAPFRFNDFGANFAGPIHRDTTFFFVNYEGGRQRIAAIASGTVPSALLRERTLAASPALKPILDLMPRGSAPTADPLVDSYTTTQVSSIREDTGSVRIDHRFNDRNAAFFRLNVNDSHVFGPLFANPNAANAFGLLDLQDAPIRTSNIALHDQALFSPRFINDFTAGVQRWENTLNTDYPRLPIVFVTGLTIQTGSRGFSVGNFTSYQLGDSLSLNAGAHTWRWGATVWNPRLVRRSDDAALLDYISLNDFIRNRAFLVNVAGGDPGSATEAYETGAFVQDTWQIRPGLTLDAGLRYDFATPPFDPQGKSRAYDSRTGGLAPAGTPYFRANKTNLAPRLAFGWQAAPRLVVRAGYGLFYAEYPPGLAAGIRSNTLIGTTLLLVTQTPNLSFPIQPFLSQGAHPLPGVTGFDQNKPDAYAEQWNFTLLLAASSSDAIEAAYVGNRGVHLRRAFNINFIDPATGRAPNPNFSGILLETSSGASTYHALQLSWRRSFRAGLQGFFNYRWSHAIDDVPDSGLMSTQPQDNNDLRAERGNGGSDQRHAVSYAMLYDLPFGHSRRSATGIVERFASGWQLAGVGLLHTGLPQTITIGPSLTGNGNTMNQRPDAVVGADPYASDRTVDHWFNPAAFRMPAPGKFGNLGRNTVRGPGLAQVDESLLKETRVNETLRLQFRAEMFNVLNHPNFDQPNAMFATPSFGRIFNTVGRTLGMGTARQIELAMRLSF